MINQVSKYVNLKIRNILLSQEETLLNNIYEIRLRIDNPIYVKTSQGSFFITDGKKSNFRNENYYKIKKSDIISTVAAITSNSLHAYEKEIEKGYITIEGGHRVGLSGDCIYEKDNFKGFKNITSLNIRVARSFIGCSKNVFKYVIKDNKKIFNTLIAGPPLSGKTTCIRDLSRLLSNGNDNPYFKGCDVVIIDERGEIAAMYDGIPQMDIGCRTDILSYCIKKDGFGMSIRAMAPGVIISDELGSQDDFNTVQYALKSGVNIISTAHGSDINDLFNNVYLKSILDFGFIERIIVLKDYNQISIKQVFDNINKRVIYNGCC